MQWLLIFTQFFAGNAGNREVESKLVKLERGFLNQPSAKKCICYTLYKFMHSSEKSKETSSYTKSRYFSSRLSVQLKCLAFQTATPFVGETLLVAVLLGFCLQSWTTPTKTQPSVICWSATANNVIRMEPQWKWKSLYVFLSLELPTAIA